MKNNKLKQILLPAFVCGFVAGVLEVVPFIKNTTCCLVIPIAAIFSVLLYAKSNNILPPLKLSQCIVVGIVTGLFAGFFSTTFDQIITLITKNNNIISSLPEVEKLFAELPPSTPNVKETIELFRQISKEIQLYGFSFVYLILTVLSNFFINLLFAIIGSIIAKFVVPEYLTK